MLYWSMKVGASHVTTPSAARILVLGRLRRACHRRGPGPPPHRVGPALSQANPPPTFIDQYSKSTPSVYFRARNFLCSHIPSPILTTTAAL